MITWEVAFWTMITLAVGFMIVCWALILACRRLLRERNASWLLIRRIRLELERGDLKSVHFLAAGADNAIEEVIDNEK